MLFKDFKNEHITGLVSIIGTIYCLFINIIHGYLSNTSKLRQTIFGKNLLFWSNVVFIVSKEKCYGKNY